MKTNDRFKIATNMFRNSVYIFETKARILFIFRNVTLNPKANADLRYNSLLRLFKEDLNHHRGARDNVVG
jgi:hypothetical protein